MDNLWSISKSDLKADNYDEPTLLLKEQIEYFDRMTNGTLYGHLSNFRVKESICEFPFGLIFEIIAPNLNGYRYRVFTMYSSPIKEYPVLIYYGDEPDNSFINEVSANFVCENKNDFEGVLKKILGSEDLGRIIKILYSKSMI